MIGIVMAGGKGTRMDCPGNEKLLLKYKKPVILHVVDSLRNSGCFSKILAVTSPNSPKTRRLLKDTNIEIFDSPGAGYAKDLNYALCNINDSVLVASGDLPLLDGAIINGIVEHSNPKNVWTSVLVTKDFLNSINLKSDYSTIFEGQTCHYTGISVVNAAAITSMEILPEQYMIINDKRIALNLNTRDDLCYLGTA